MNPEIAVSYTSTINRLPHLGGHYLEVTPAIMAQLNAKPGARLICQVNQIITFPCGLVALGNGCAYILLSAKRLKEAALKLNQEVTVNLKPDLSPYGMEMPEELAALLEQDEVGKIRFEQLTPGKQRTLMYSITAVKNPQLRVDRTIRYIENLKKQPPGKESVSRILA
ncbi:YdeI/OmpD-associated family protein [Adhaeribacter pallidiroseus]|uniref:DUF1905 domain-containing protein n=1 Tax=Adhaeribacter pallidiroseus TaxID=2072847 RepID=A0A369QH26_9BACT|nr:YdeI/OmpD-associated family protein [Adhaeribacter pallidiroseus]RDC63732.1 hypothetical protein AHMF7616_02340 [Adhaeribacter pallidiroseus]